MRDLVGVAVERERGTAPELADPPLGGLAPARVVDRGVDVRVETVLLRRGLVPRGWRLLTREPDPHDRFRALESVLPRHDHADRGAVLVRQHLAVHADGQERQRVERLVEAQPLRVRPVERRSEKARPLAGELSRVEQRREFDVLRLPGRLNPLEQRGEWHADPRDDHRPPLDAAERVDTLLERGEPEQVVGLRLVDEPVHLDRPRPRRERVREPRGVILVHAELVEVVVSGRRLELRGRFPQAQRLVAGRPERLALRSRRPALAGQEGQQGRADHPFTAGEIELRVGDLVGCEPSSAPDQHAGTASSLTIIGHRATNL